MKHRLLALFVALFALFTISVSGCGGADCGDDDKNQCNTNYQTCVNSCDPLGGDFQGCQSTCATKLCDCLKNAGCECNNS